MGVDSAAAGSLSWFQPTRSFPLASLRSSAVSSALTSASVTFFASFLEGGITVELVLGLSTTGESEGGSGALLFFPAWGMLASAGTDCLATCLSLSLMISKRSSPFVSTSSTGSLLLKAKASHSSANCSAVRFSCLQRRTPSGEEEPCQSIPRPCMSPTHISWPHWSPPLHPT